MSSATPDLPHPPHRDGGVELFRCLLMFLVVSLHVCELTPLSQGHSALFLYAATIPAVDGFVSISGWYGIRFAWRKFFRLWGLMVFYMALSTGAVVLAKLLDPAFPVGIPRPFGYGGWWFAVTYLALMMVAPIVNAGLETLAKTPRQLWIALGLLVAMECMTWGLLPLGVQAVSWDALSLENLVFVYVVARALSLLGCGEWLKRVGRWAFPLLMLFLVALVPLREWVGELTGYSQLWKFQLVPMGCDTILSGLSYDAPLIWMTGLAGFVFFLSIKTPYWLSRVAGFIGPSMFGVYLIHTTKIAEFGYTKVAQWAIETFPNTPTIVLALLVSALVFCSALALDLIRRGGLALLRARFGR